MAATLLGEEPRLGSTPLAMLAATCSRIGEPGPSCSPALSDGAPGLIKGFHPWKRGAQGAGSFGTCLTSLGISAGSSRAGGAGLTERPVFLTKFPSSVEGIAGIYPRMHAHPYDSGSSAWWDMGTGWVDAQSPPGCTSLTASDRLARRPTPRSKTAAAPALKGAPVVSLPPSSRSSSRRYSGRATCDCPNCQEAESLGLHSCHIPGCGKVYGQDVSPEGSPALAHRGAAVRLQLALLRVSASRAPTSSSGIYARTPGRSASSAPFATSASLRSDHLSKHVRTHSADGSGDGGEPGLGRGHSDTDTACPGARASSSTATQQNGKGETPS
uniref:Sp8 transcription factor n=1 Tax=Salarias fasciatus TaxID=181472 RepID=A0A672HI44_SALFA